MEIAPLLRIERGVTALIGGGGKTTLLYTLAEELRGKGTVIVCTSTHILRPGHLDVITSGDAGALRDALKARGVICAGTPAADGKLTASPLPFEKLAALADYVLVEADGAKRLPLKAHDAHEPVIPTNAERIVLVIGADGFGRPIADVCHRPVIYARLAGASQDDLVTPELAARVIQAEGYGDCVFINKAESADRLNAAEELAGLLTCPVIAGSLHQGVYSTWRV